MNGQVGTDYTNTSGNKIVGNMIASTEVDDSGLEVRRICAQAKM